MGTQKSGTPGRGDGRRVDPPDVPGGAPASLLEPAAVGDLLRILREQGYRTIGPTLQDEAIVYDEIEGLGDLPAGLTDRQQPGEYRIEERSDDALFGYNLGPRSWKQYFFPPSLRLFAARRAGRGFEIEPPDADPPALALIGIRPCEIAGLDVQARVFTGGGHVDPWFAAARERAFLVAVQCAQAAATCFCGSMSTGPRAERGFDLALTELLDEGEHRFLVEPGSARGREVLAVLHPTPAGPAERARAEAATRRAESQLSRSVDGEGLPELLEAALEHPRWAEVAERCLSCANCTMVCPTCFCHTVEEVNDLSGERTERWRRWDSCFSGEHAYIHGGDLRPSTRGRYRQWLTHKFGTWHAQFGSSGCVGCGRCIAWCPVGIDVTEELAALRVGSDRAETAETEEAT